MYISYHLEHIVSNLNIENISFSTSLLQHYRTLLQNMRRKDIKLWMIVYPQPLNFAEMSGAFLQFLIENGFGQILPYKTGSSSSLWKFVRHTDDHCASVLTGSYFRDYGRRNRFYNGLTTLPKYDLLYYLLKTVS